MNRFLDSPFEAELEVVATLADRAFNATIEELRKEDELTLALRGMLRNGISVDDLSDATGLTPEEIRRRCARELNILSGLDELMGVC